MKKYIDYKDIFKVFKLTNGRFIRQVEWDMLWHICFGNPFSWDTKYNRIPAKSLGGYMSHICPH